MCTNCWVGTEARGSKGRREWGCVQEGVMTEWEGGDDDKGVIRMVKGRDKVLVHIVI